MIHFLYNILLTIFLILYIPYQLIRKLFKKLPPRLLKERLGGFPNLSSQHPVWVHAASVGEVLCCIPLLKRIRQEKPDLAIVLSTMTYTGNETAKRLVPEADWILFFPWDHPFLIRRALKRLSPRLFLLAETELWPNLLRLCGYHHIPVSLFNGRISETSLRGYLFLKSFFMKSMQAISFFLMQSEEDRNRIIEIGAPPERTTVVGNIKFDQIPPSQDTESASNLLSTFGLNGHETILIAGSTHPGEEEMLLQIYQNLKVTFSPLILLLAPRHLNRLDEVERILNREGLSWKRRSSLIQKDKEEVAEVILLDTMGELMKVYSLGTIVFIGGSLVSIGGHNPLEPLLYKKCTLFGPYMFNFLEISRRLIAEGGAVLVKDKEELSSQLRRLLTNEKERKEIGEKGYRFLQKHRGATERIFEKIRPFLR